MFSLVIASVECFLMCQQRGVKMVKCLLLLFFSNDCHIGLNQFTPTLATYPFKPSIRSNLQNLCVLRFWGILQKVPTSIFTHEWDFPVIFNGRVGVTVCKIAVACAKWFNSGVCVQQLCSNWFDVVVIRAMLFSLQLLGKLCFQQLRSVSTLKVWPLMYIINTL